MFLAATKVVESAFMGRCVGFSRAKNISNSHSWSAKEGFLGRKQTESAYIGAREGFLGRKQPESAYIGAYRGF